ncbi:hypothetical protein WNY51_02500 [Pseudocolwellia sp. AS88]|uniref:hypothetical protein n=1 Tax=Pseudocolwellia sp. AS88 TaxID=3063958 RepID=UPI0026EF1549|nr:hypothetical protein [Pseudocolwellia sp. AS88]MDO7084461.1 hypothetical protein [Pseudocolwellia sp. AS88]
MQTEVSIPEYLSGDFSMYLENMNSLADPENPDLLTNYLSNLFKQLQEMPLLFTGMPDQLAMAIATKVRIDSKSLAKIELSEEPTWADVKAFVGVHADARACITEIMENAEQDLKTAILLIHFYNGYDATPLKAEENDDDDDDYGSNGYESDDYDENY